MTTTQKQDVKLAAFLDRIHAFTGPILADAATDGERALALLLDQVGGLVEHHIKAGQPVGLLPYRVKTLLDAIEAEGGSTTRRASP